MRVEAGQLRMFKGTPGFYDSMNVWPLTFDDIDYSSRGFITCVPIGGLLLVLDPGHIDSALGSFCRILTDGVVGRVHIALIREYTVPVEL